MSRFARTSLCAALVSSTLLAGCTGGAGPVAVAPPATRPMTIQSTAAADAVAQIGNANRVYLDACYAVFAHQVGNGNWILADGNNRALVAGQIGNGNRIVSE